MSETTNLFSELKRALKARGKTYRDLADFLQLSESSVKRIFANRDLSLKRLEQICRWLGLSIMDLSVAADAQQPSLSRLTAEQEEQLVQDPLLLLVATCAMNQWSFDEIIGYYRITELECISKLVQLDRIGLVELLPGNRIKLRIAPNFRWQPDGPIQRFFKTHVANEFFDCRFADDNDLFLALNGTLSPQSNLRFQEQMVKLADHFNQLVKEDLKLPFTARRGNTAVIALRQWSLAMFDQYKREQTP